VSVLRWLFGRLGAPTRQRLRRLVKRPRWGNLRRPQPFDDRFGFRRGIPVDRYYMERFIAANATCIRGVAGEIADDTYTTRHGVDRLERVEIIDLDPANPAATMVADLNVAGSLPAGTFDCLIVTQVLQYVLDPGAVVRELVRALRPGGTLLIAVPALTPHDTYEAIEGDRWRFWPAGLRHLLLQAAPASSPEVVASGNLVAATAFLQGISADELSRADLARHDPRFPVVVCGRLGLPAATVEGKQR
jgi:SAM-dependent methyltransferase